MLVPVVCPHCYKNLQSPSAGSDGLIHCDACGHAFPAAGALAASAPPAYKPLPSYQPSFSAQTAAPPAKYQPVYPPAAGPANPGNPGLVACGMIAMFGVMGLLCCGSLGFVVYGLGNQQLANQAANPPAFNQPNFNPPNFNPPIIPQQPFPNTPQPVFPDIPKIEPDIPFGPGASIPGTPTPPTPKTLDDFLQAMESIDPANFTARQLLEEFNTLPVDEGRRTEVVDAVLKLLGRAGVHGRGLMAGPAQITLENWTSEAEATSVARFAADDANHFSRRHLVDVLAKVGGDAETAQALLPLLKEPSAGRSLAEAFTKIGPEAEDPLLGQLETAEHFARITLFDVLGKVGGAKTKAKLQALLKNARGIDSGLGRKALREIEQRELANTQ